MIVRNSSLKRSFETVHVCERSHFASVAPLNWSSVFSVAICRRQPTEDRARRDFFVGPRRAKIRAFECQESQLVICDMARRLALDSDNFARSHTGFALGLRLHCDFNTVVCGRAVFCRLYWRFTNAREELGDYNVVLLPVMALMHRRV